MILKKKGLSPVIASVLLILMVVALVAMIFVWSRAFFNDQTQDSELSSRELCSAVNFNAMFDNEGNTLEIINRGNIDISAFEIKAHSGGDSEIIKVNISVLAGKSVEQDIEDISSFDEIEIIPVLNGKSSKKSFACYSDSVPLLNF